MSRPEPRDVVIIGSGPAGLTAAIYTARANLKPLCIAGYEAGGQLMITSDVENYPGFAEAITGPELMERFRKQAERFGTEFIDKDVTKVDFSKPIKKLWVEDEVIEARAVIIATGASAKWLGLENEQRLRGRGVSACATCDGFFFKEKIVGVVGGGDTAMEEALFLTKFATKVFVIHRRDEFRASKIMQDRVLSHPKIEVVWNTEVLDVLGDQSVSGLKLENTKEKRVYELPVGGFFLAIGHKPNTDVFKGVLELEPTGYIKVNPANETVTRIPGVFVAGDVFDHRYRQAVTAAGSGCKAAIEAEKWLETTTSHEISTEKNW
ncbi:MAG TPA: thioredoxin-disulfide reductase [Candidatus Thermoplasmatota archaeon]|nr:thioredoxin-disulfide reductase [Candidatus Thermoplasmatota archaeon]